MNDRSILLVLALAAVAALGSAATAGTQTFLETNEDQFAKGEADGVVPTSLGTLRLGRALESLLAETEGVDYVARLAEGPDGSVYAVTGGSGRVYRAKGGKVSLVATLDDHYLFSVIVDKNGDVYVGSGGTKGRIWRLVPQEKGDATAEVIFEADDVKYVWDLAWLSDGTLAAATGDQGKLLRIAPNKKAEVLIDSEADHVLCLATAADGTLYAGTDGEAVVYRWADKKSFILYDAAENEITSLAVDAAGNVYAGASNGQAGRTGGVTIHAEPPSPAPPQPAEGASQPTEDEAKPADDAEKPSPTGAALATAIKVANSVRAARPTGATGAAAAAAGASTAVYRITPEGLATPIFAAKDRMVLALAVVDGRLLVGTGENARVYEVSLSDGGEEQACVGTVDPKQVMALLVTQDGRTVVGSAGPGRLYTLSPGCRKEGTYTSQVYDAGGSARWGELQWRGTTPAGTGVAIATRSGNVRDPEKGMWSDWSKGLTKLLGPVTSPAARFLQFRVTMNTNQVDTTPVLEQFEAAYLRANEPPKVLSIIELVTRDRQTRAKAIEQFLQAMKNRSQGGQKGGAPPPPPPPEGAQPIRILQWRAQDPNGDDLRYDLYFRGQGEPNWVPLEADLSRSECPWDTATVADGWYEIRVVASDRADRPAETAREDSRVSDPILVDNTAPLIEKIEVKVRQGAEGGEADVRFAARDVTGRLAEAAYTLDSATDWHTLAPVDGLFDAQTEEFRFTVKGLKEGPHRLAIRVVDEADNRGHAAQTLTVAK